MDIPKPDLTEELNDICHKNGIEIFTTLKNRYPNRSVEHFDILMNSLCCALVTLRMNATHPDLYTQFNGIVKTILEKN